MQRVGVLPAVLLVAHDDEVGRERDDGLDVGVLRAADVRQVGLLAEPGARDGATPQASSVSVTDGTRLTTRTGVAAAVTCGRATRSSSASNSSSEIRPRWCSSASFSICSGSDSVRATPAP